MELSANTSSSIIWPTSVGIVPVSFVRAKSRYVKFTRFPTCVGIGPTNEFRLSINDCRKDKAPSSVGRGPVSKLFCKFRRFKPVKSPNVVGSVPPKPLVLKESLRRDPPSKPISGGMSPNNALSSIATSVREPESSQTTNDHSHSFVDFNQPASDVQLDEVVLPSTPPPVEK